MQDSPLLPDNRPLLSADGHARRDYLKGGAALLLGGIFAGYRSASFAAEAPPLLGFSSVPLQLDRNFDRVIVPPGYRAQAFFSWGDPVTANAPAWSSDASQDWQAQLQQAGENHDGMHYFPFADAPNAHGLLVINHEYVNETLLPQGPTLQTLADGRFQRLLDEVKKEQAAHGVSVIEVKANAAGQWQRVFPSPYNRRISGFTPIDFSGPVAGTDWLKTAADPTGKTVLGTLNNCAMGFTPWGTFLTCEENWHDYFVNRNKADYAGRPSHHRYHISNGPNSNKFHWESADPRFDATPDFQQSHGAYVNEPHRFGWVVEFDPFDPQSRPVKRTAMGRLFREGATPSLREDGSLAFYSGDDMQGEYLYKFVPSRRYSAENPAANRDLLDAGILYVARFSSDSASSTEMEHGANKTLRKGEWLPLQYGRPELTPERGFHSQADVLVMTRVAADLVGATRLDRPEWVAIHPQTREGFVTLTKNPNRGKKTEQPVDAVNPRAENHFGQIVRWREANDDPAATTFHWEHFLLAGPDSDGGTIKGDLFACPDGIWFDRDGRLWIETDFDDGVTPYMEMGTNQLLCADPNSGEVRRFLVGPVGCEITGITSTTDGRALWINVQHPTLSYPASDNKTRPRSTTVLITRDDGGVIGS